MKNSNCPLIERKRVGSFLNSSSNTASGTYCCSFSSSSASRSAALLQVTGLVRCLVCNTGVCGSVTILATVDLVGNGAVNRDQRHSPGSPRPHLPVGANSSWQPRFSSVHISQPDKYAVPSSLSLFTEGYDDGSLLVNSTIIF